MDNSLLPLLIAIPFFSATFIALISQFNQSEFSRKSLAFLLSLLPICILLFGYGNWNGTSIDYPWISALDINFHLSVDTLSIIFIALTVLITPVAISAVETNSSPMLFYALIFLLQGALLILFTARDLALFAIAWEAILLPIYFILLIWGGTKRQAAALQFFIYMIAGSALFVAAVLGLYFSTPIPTFNLDLLAEIASSTPYATLFFAIFLLAFGVKTPLFPFHAWLPETYFQAPFAGSILLAALLSKAGIYGIARIGYGLFPDLMALYSPLLVGFAIVGALYGALAAWTQTDYKRLIAYSSLSHVNFILVGLFLASQVAIQGALLQAFNHGITIASLFLVAAWLERRTQSTAFKAASGITQIFPRLSWLTLVFVLSSIAIPGTNNFVGEFLILYGLLANNAWLTVLLGLTIIFSAMYMLRWMEKVYYGELKETTIVEIPDIGTKEFIVAIPLIALILATGIYPAPILQQLEPASEKLTTGKSSLTADRSEDQKALEQQLDEELLRQKGFEHQREDESQRQAGFQKQEVDTKVQQQLLQKQYDDERQRQDLLQRQYDSTRQQQYDFDRRRSDNAVQKRDLDRRREEDRRRNR
ncbi:MAG: NADH-quinone oxidoreductase subunit M [Parachlamydiaceae bacterium]|nr:NADH-quinone oxidoreductase subunit M [Parachlamydiaceae bacterium]